MTIIEAIAAALIKWLAGWLEGRSARKAEAAAASNRAGAIVDSQAIRDETTRKVDESHAQTDASLDRIDRVPAGSDQLRAQYEETQRAIDRANGDVR